MDNSIVFEVFESHPQLNDHIRDLFRVGQRQLQIIQTTISPKLHHNEEEVILPVGRVAPDHVRVVRQPSYELNLVSEAKYLLAIVLAVELQRNLGVERGTFLTAKKSCPSCTLKTFPKEPAPKHWITFMS